MPAAVTYIEYSKTCLKRPLKKNTKICFQYQLSLNESQKYCRMLQGEHFVILSTFIKLQFTIKTFFLSGRLRKALLDLMRALYVTCIPYVKLNSHLLVLITNAYVTIFQTSIFRNTRQFEINLGHTEGVVLLRRESSLKVICESQIFNLIFAIIFVTTNENTNVLFKTY